MNGATVNRHRTKTVPVNMPPPAAKFQEEICESIRAGNYIETSAARSGVHKAWCAMLLRHGLMKGATMNRHRTKTVPVNMPPPAAKRYRPNGALERRKDWIRSCASGLIRMSQAGIERTEAGRAAQAGRAVDMACRIWDLVETRFVSDKANGKDKDGGGEG